jgi:hypothetical protein
MARFLLSHAKDLLRPSDAGVLLSMESAERGRKNSNDSTSNEAIYSEWWPIAAASLRSEASGRILDEAEQRYPEAANITLARWNSNGMASLPKILLWFYRSPQAEELLPLEIERAEPNDQYKPLAEAILASSDRLRINGKAMYVFARLAEKWKADFDQRFVDWIYAQSPDADLGIMGPPRELVIRTSGVSRKLVRDSRFRRADGELVYVLEQLFVGDMRLSGLESERLDQLIGDIDVRHPQSTPESKLQEIRNLLLKGVGN